MRQRLVCGGVDDGGALPTTARACHRSGVGRTATAAATTAAADSSVRGCSGRGGPYDLLHHATVAADVVPGARREVEPARSTARGYDDVCIRVGRLAVCFRLAAPYGGRVAHSRASSGADASALSRSREKCEFRQLECSR